MKRTQHNPRRNDYILLGRYQMDVEYWLNYGNQNDSCLYFGNKKDHITEMVKLYNTFAGTAPCFGF